MYDRENTILSDGDYAKRIREFDLKNKINLQNLFDFI
jgi:hypothetical protein